MDAKSAILERCPEPTATPTATFTASPTHTVTPTGTATPTASATPTPTPVRTAVATQSPTPPVSPTETPGAQPTPLPTASAPTPEATIPATPVGTSPPVATTTPVGSPTAQPTITVTPVETLAPGEYYLCHVPSDDMTKARTLKVSESGRVNHLEQHDLDFLGRCEDGRPTPTPTPTITPTATPAPLFFKLKGSLKSDKNGRKLTARDMNNLAGKNLTLMVQRMDGDKKLTKLVLGAPYLYALNLPKGEYSVWLRMGQEMTVASLPRRYTLSLNNNQDGIHFAPRVRWSALTGGSASTAALRAGGRE